MSDLVRPSESLSQLISRENYDSIRVPQQSLPSLSPKAALGGLPHATELMRRSAMKSLGLLLIDQRFRSELNTQLGELHTILLTSHCDPDFALSHAHQSFRSIEKSSEVLSLPSLCRVAKYGKFIAAQAVTNGGPTKAVWRLLGEAKRCISLLLAAGSPSDDQLALARTQLFLQRSLRHLQDANDISAVEAPSN